MRSDHLCIRAYGHAGKIAFLYDQVRCACAQDRFPGGSNEYEVRGVVLCLQGRPDRSGF
jgi:hypothetical protein